MTTAEHTAARHDPEAWRLGLGFGVLVALTFGLIVLGALVRAHHAGLACPDWPRCFGSWLPAFDLRVAFEWTHRLVAGSLALSFMGLSAWLLRRQPLRRRVARPLALAAALLALQILLGGLTVLLRLASWSVTAHLLTGNAFAATLLVVHLRLIETSKGRLRAPAPRSTRWASTVALALLAAQMLLGGLVASRYAGLACPQWPTCADGQWFPSWSGAQGVHLLHRTNGYLVIVAVLAAAWLARHQAVLRGVLAAAAVLALLQGVVGVANVLLEVPVELTGLHSALATALVLALVAGAREAWASPEEPAGGGARVPLS